MARVPMLWSTGKKKSHVGLLLNKQHIVILGIIHVRSINTA